MYWLCKAIAGSEVGGHANSDKRRLEPVAPPVRGLGLVPLAKQHYRPRVAEAFPAEAEAKCFARSRRGGQSDGWYSEPSFAEEGDRGGGYN
jgi:hypothetical protein